jgi:ABC-type sugar transport system ATPase subunit
MGVTASGRPSATTATAPPLFTLSGIHKRFGGVQALRGAHVTIGSGGTVHALAGQNGSGKSTLLAVLSGQHRADSGEILLDGNLVRFASPISALKHGVAMVAQETAVAPSLTVTENILLGRQMVRGRSGIDRPASRRKASAVLERLGLDYDPDALVGQLRPDQQQMVEIGRAVSMNARLLILDEPTSSLTDDEVSRLLVVVRELRDNGIAVMFVSHRLPEVFGVCDTVTVLRDGATVAEGPISVFTPHTLVEAMVGATSERPRSKPRSPRAASSQQRLRVRDACAGPVQDVSIDVGTGEIVGLAGLVGAGRGELMEGIFGLRPLLSGSVEIDGRSLSLQSPRASISAGIGYLPPERKTQGLLLRMDIAANVAMTATAHESRIRTPRRGREASAAEAACRDMSIRTPSVRVPVGSLSGGNQQKVALARCLALQPRVLLLDEPTRGVDVNAKAELHEILRAAAEEGLALLVSSSEDDELLALCDRICVMARGRVVATRDCEGLEPTELARLAGGHE